MTLSATRAKALQEPGRYSDGGGLHLYISKAGRKSWVLRITVYGRRRDIGLGGYPSASLALACKKAADTRAAVAEGPDPVVEKHAPATPTLNNTPLDRIYRRDVLRVLTPLWTTRPVRQRMRTVFKWAISYGFMESNPAGEAIDGALPHMPKVKAHFRALPYQEVKSALETVATSQASMSAKLCFRFLVLTAARSGEARGATWDEIDLQGQEWRIPSARMKAGTEHRVPLSGQALDLLGEASALREDTSLVFPPPLRPGAPREEQTSSIPRRLGYSNGWCLPPKARLGVTGKVAARTGGGHLPSGANACVGDLALFATGLR